MAAIPVITYILSYHPKQRYGFIRINLADGSSVDFDKLTAAEFSALVAILSDPTNQLAYDGNFLFQDISLVKNNLV